MGEGRRDSQTMAIDTVETPSSSPTSQSRHFYVAVDRHEFKMDTFVDLLGVAARHKNLSIVVCCSSRDELDAVCSAVSNLSFVSLSSLYSDLSQSDRALVLQQFRQHAISLQLVQDVVDDEDEKKSFMLVVTDVCLPLVSSGEAPIAARLLINFELPTKKEIYLRRTGTCLAADGIVINTVVGGEVVTLKSIEENSNLIIAEMPIKISEIL